MMKTMKYLPSFATCALLLISQAAFAQPRGGMGPGRQRFFKELNLSEEQKKQLANEEPGKGQEMMQELFNEREKLDGLLKDKTAPEEAIYAQLSRMNDVRARMSRFHVERMLKLRKILTDEQYKKMLEMKEERRKEFGPMGGHWGKGHGQDEEDRGAGCQGMGCGGPGL